MKLYNTLTRKQEILSINNNIINMYICGVTPYASSHIGHAMSSVVFDVLRRYLEFKGFNVNHIQNFTDIDDKMIQVASELGISTVELADNNIKSFLTEMDLLNNLRAKFYPRATEEIDKIIEIISNLISKDLAYHNKDGVYFRVDKVENYGKLSRRTLKDMISGSRVEVDENKENSMDFALWKSKKSGEPFWNSPWGDGRPGWHIECSAMSIKYLGNTIDIHGGGQDLIFPHHENEIVQSEAFTQEIPFSKFWLHNGLLRMGSDKMSKSVGNIVLIKDVLNKFSSNAVRMFILSSHYRSPLDYSEDNIMGKENSIKKLYKVLEHTGGVHSNEINDLLESRKQQFINAMDDDLNTPRAIATIFDLSKDLNQLINKNIDITEGQILLNRLTNVLGIELTNKNKESDKDLYLEPLMSILTDIRFELRNKKEFELADKIRSGLYDLGINLEDNPKGTRWNFIEKGQS
ncbi:MAG: cysteine--tRNA ligase [Chloroflexi bacterium]|nr:cysteine--tRNA ligase [Chloroflexota bacterium]|tara:strand:- start:56419 stop:57807 length:1389 start_codon:yes stop_codon:yes gene_type:complete